MKFTLLLQSYMRTSKVYIDIKCYDEDKICIDNEVGELMCA